jgi:glycosyltransferase involved in cell wall biosynthesis
VRIAYFTDTREIGGAEQNLVDMARVAVDAGHDVWLLAPQAELVSWMAERVPGACVRRVGHDGYFDIGPPARRVAEMLRQSRRLGGVLRALRVDLLHVNNGGFPGSDLCRLAPLAARAAGVPRRIMTVHSNPWPRERLSDARVQVVADTLVWRNVDVVLCPAAAVRRGLVERRGAPERLMRILHYGVAEPPAAAAQEVAALRRRLAPGDELLVGMVSARAVAVKGYDVFAAAMARAGSGIRGALVGALPGGEVGRSLEALGDCVTLEGVVRPIGAHYRAFDLVVVPSTDEECMPLVILEAMAAARPVAGSHISGIPEAIADGLSGWTFAPGDVAALVAVLHEARSARQSLTAKGEAGRERWERLFTPEIMRAGLLALYG